MKVEKIVSKHLDSNTFVAFDSDNIFVIDAGADLDDVLKITNGKKVSAVLLTHAHFDHLMNLDAYIKAFNCDVFISIDGIAGLLNSDLNFGEAFSIKSGLENFVAIESDESLEIDGSVIKAISARGHSPCSTIYLFESGDLFAGDVLFDHGIGRVDLCENGKEDMLKTLSSLQSLEFVTLHSGHGNDSSFAAQQRNIITFIKFLSRKNG